MTRKFAMNARRVATAAGFAAVGALLGGTSTAIGGPEGMSPPDRTPGVLAVGAAINAPRFNSQTVVRSEFQLMQSRALPEAELKDAYSTCSRHAMERALGSGEAAACSIVYETLLRTVFGGDFEALLLWSRNHPTR